MSHVTNSCVKQLPKFGPGYIRSPLSTVFGMITPCVTAFPSITVEYRAESLSGRVKTLVSHP